MYNYGCDHGYVAPTYGCETGHGYAAPAYGAGNAFALIVVLFILLIIVGAAYFC